MVRHDVFSMLSHHIRYGMVNFDGKFEVVMEKRIIVEMHVKPALFPSLSHISVKRMKGVNVEYVKFSKSIYEMDHDGYHADLRRDPCADCC
jgi:hypothetical protein